MGISPHVAAHLPGVDRVIPCLLPGPPDATGAPKTAFPSLLYLGSRKSRKRGDLALELWRGLREEFPDLRLSYVGPRREVDELRGRAGLAGVDFRSRVSQEELIALYRESWAYLCLSSYEGFGVGIIDNTVIDEVNILQATFLAMHKAIDGLKKKPSLLIIDGNRFKPFEDIKHKTIIGGDELYMEIAAASVLAKTYRDELMEQLHHEFPQYNWEQNKGYGTSEHREAIQQYGKCKYHRLSFRLLKEEQLSLFE